MNHSAVCHNRLAQQHWLFPEHAQCYTGTNAVQQAVGRIVGALCVVTGKDEDAESAMLASWISQVHCCGCCVL